MRGHTDGTDTRSAAAVWDGEGLMQVKVHHVKAQITGPDDTKQGVEIRAITVHQTTTTMNQLDHLFDVLIEETERVRVGEHHTDHTIVTGGFERVDVNVSTFIGWDLHDLQTHHADRGGVCPVRGSGDDHLDAFRVAA